MTNIKFKPANQNDSASCQNSVRRPAYMHGYSKMPALKLTGRTALVNIKEQDDKFVIKVAIPGYSKEDISLQLDGNTLKVSGKKEVATTSKYHLKEFDLVSFERLFSLSELADTDKIEAITVDGILTISILKKEVKKPIHIAIS